MCNGCSPRKDATEPAGAARRPGGARFTRRSILAAATSLAAGVIAGLWSCQDAPQKTAPRTTVLPDSTPPSPAPSSQPLAAAPDVSRDTPSTTRGGPTPDLGSEVFPDARGNPIARASDAPVIVVPRADWTAARPHLDQIDPMNGIACITVHHTAMGLQTDAWQPTASELETIREFHAGTRPTDRQWADIAYHFAVDRAGRVWQARPLAYQGAHVKGHNEHNLGIVLMGNFQVQSPSAAQLTSLELFIDFTRRLYKVPLDQVFTHGELGQTECPGKLLQGFMDRFRQRWATAEGIAWRPPTRPTNQAAQGSL